MMQAIVTRYMDPTNTRGSRIKATAEAGSIIFTWEPELNSEANHMKAAEALANKFGWLEHSSLVGGGMPGNNGNCYVMVPRPQTKVTYTPVTGRGLARNGVHVVSIERETEPHRKVLSASKVDDLVQRIIDLLNTHGDNL